MNKNSKVLALKYRPQTFDDLIGQEVVAETIKNAIKLNKTPNAYLFTGIRGIGKTTTARIVAKSLNCLNGIDNLCKDNLCENCEAISNSSHIDVLEMDAASKTGVDDVRDLIEFSRYGPTSAKYKIFIIDEVHMLSKQAFNALLKTLEEPPEYLKFIFATTEIKKIPITVISRCQRFDLSRIKSSELFEFIKKIKDKENGIEKFVKDLTKKTKILYFDEFQVTNIVDAMILGKLFKKIFEEKILVLFSSNIRIKDLYKDGLQREQFLPFIKILQDYSYEKELLIDEDYRTNANNGLERFLAPINEKTNFIFNKFFRTLTKNINKENKILEIKGRNLVIDNFFNGIAKFNFDELCNRNIGSEDYIKIANNCSFIFLENLPNFNYTNSNQQQRFITLIDILYEKKIPLMITSEKSLDKLGSSLDISNTFKRTISRLHELTSLSFQSK